MLHIARLAGLQHELLTLLQPMLRLMRRWQSPLTEQLGRQHAAGGSLCKAWCTAEGWVHIQPAHHQCTFKRSKLPPSGSHMQSRISYAQVQPRCMMKATCKLS